MMSDVRRREFITLLGGAAAAAWPLAAPAQQGERMRRVAFLHPYTENDPEVLARVVAFRQGLEALGWTENRISESSIDILAEIWVKSKLTRQSWCVWHRTSSSAAARQLLPHYNGRPTPSRSFSTSSTIRLDRASWRHCRIPAAISPASPSLTFP